MIFTKRETLALVRKKKGIGAALCKCTLDFPGLEIQDFR